MVLAIPWFTIVCFMKWYLIKKFVVWHVRFSFVILFLPIIMYISLMTLCDIKLSLYRKKHRNDKKDKKDSTNIFWTARLKIYFSTLDWKHSGVEFSVSYLRFHKGMLYLFLGAILTTGSLQQAAL